MELIISLKNTNQIKLNADSFLLGTKFGVRNDIFTLDEIKQAIDSTSKNIYINVDKIFSEIELGELTDYLLEVKSLNVSGIYFSDMAVYTISKEIGIIDKLIYNPGTLVTNLEDVLFYLELGLKRVCLAREITLENIQKIIECSTDVEVIIHGHLNMFYSKRKILSNFFNYTNQEVKQKGHLIEETRDEPYPIIEDSNGSHIFHANILNSFDELKYFENISVRIDGFLFDETYLEDITNIYSELRNSFDSEKSKSNYSLKYDFNKLSSGYYYKETKYMKK